MHPPKGGTNWQIGKSQVYFKVCRNIKFYMLIHFQILWLDKIHLNIFVVILAVDEYVDL